MSNLSLNVVHEKKHNDTPYLTPTATLEQATSENLKVNSLLYIEKRTGGQKVLNALKWLFIALCLLTAGGTAVAYGFSVPVVLTAISAITVNIIAAAIALGVVLFIGVFIIYMLHTSSTAKQRVVIANQKMNVNAHYVPLNKESDFYAKAAHYIHKTHLEHALIDGCFYEFPQKANSKNHPIIITFLGGGSYGRAYKVTNLQGESWVYKFLAKKQSNGSCLPTPISTAKDLLPRIQEALNEEKDSKNLTTKTKALLWQWLSHPQRAAYVLNQVLQERNKHLENSQQSYGAASAIQLDDKTMVLKSPFIKKEKSKDESHNMSHYWKTYKNFNMVLWDAYASDNIINSYPIDVDCLINTINEKQGANTGINGLNANLSSYAFYTNHKIIMKQISDNYIKYHSELQNN